MLEVDNTCTIYVVVAEDEHHALVTCTLARALREGMRQFWDLPREEAFLFKGTDWLLVLLSNSYQTARPMINFLLWRAWH
jgi:urea transporter